MVALFTVFDDSYYLVVQYVCSFGDKLSIKIIFTSDSSQNDNNDKSKISSMFFEMMRK